MAQAGASARECRFIPIVAPHPTTGNDANFELKAWLYPNASVVVVGHPEVYWEARRVVDAMGLRPTTQDFYKYWKRHQPHWQLLCVAYGFIEASRIFKPSRKSLVSSLAGGESICNDPFVREEFSIATTGILAMVLYIAGGKLLRHKRSSQLVLTSLLSHVLQGSVAQDIGFWSPPADICDQCEFDAFEGRCAHMRHGLQLEHRSTKPWETVVACLVDLAHMQSTCNAARCFLEAQLVQIATALDEAICGIGHSDASRALDNDPSRYAKRRRIDEDLVVDTIMTSVETGRSASSRRMLRSKGQLCPDNGTLWERQALLHTQAAAWRVFKGSQAVHISLDGSRIGNPAEETELYAAFCGSSLKGCWLPPQATRM